MAEEYIERNALKRIFMAKGKDKLRLSTVINEIEMAHAADMVEVVRCKDCKHFSAVSRICDHPDGLWLVVKPEDGFCCYGERMDA